MVKNQIIPDNYKSILGIHETEDAIKVIKDYFESSLARELNLQRVSAPKFLKRGTGINDDLNGIERKVSFPVKCIPGLDGEVVVSLAKWKRMALADYNFLNGTGLYTDMDALRPDEDSLDNLHSIYVDQWDWEKAIYSKDRNLDFLKKTVKQIYNAMKDTEEMVCRKYNIPLILPEEIIFVHTEDLFEQFPNLISKEREDRITQKYGAVFVIGVGGELKDGKIHDGRAPDYDDWSTETGNGKKGLNGDIVVWNPVLKRSFELSSMGIRVDKETMLKQLKIRNCEYRKDLEWHTRLLNGEFPESIGGGIGQSRLCMLYLRKAHIGEVQASIWPNDVVKYLKENNIHLL